MKKVLLSTVFLLACCLGYAQDNVEMAFSLRSSGKIYAVVLVVLTIFIGIVVYLIALDRKISNLEKNKT